jgi:hypothetical protein
MSMIERDFDQVADTIREMRGAVVIARWPLST